MHNQPERRNFPLAFLGYGFLYAWGYTLWCTESLSTRSVSSGSYEFSWLISAIVVPVALVALALVSRRVDLERSRVPYVLAPITAALGTVLSVVYQYVSHETLSTGLAVLSGLGTGMASALFSVLWCLALAHLDTAALETVVPASFAISVLCALIVPSLDQIPAVVAALLLVALCAGSLLRCRSAIDAACAKGDLSTERTPDDMQPIESIPNIVRMLIFGIAAWAVMNVAPTAANDVNPTVAGIDLAAALGYILAIALALGVVRYAVRVDFQALAFVTLPLLVLSMTLYAFGSAGTLFWATVLNSALNSCCEIILVLYFIRIARARSEPRAFWLALGSAANYTGVLLGQLGDIASARLDLAASQQPLLCLVIVCIYAFAMALVPQRHPYGVIASRNGAVAKNPSSSSNINDSSHPASLPASESTPTSPFPLVPDKLDALDIACNRLAEEFRLSAREAEVCIYLAHGRSQSYIRDALFLSKNTVATHTRRLYAKLGVHSKQELIDLVESRRA